MYDIAIIGAGASGLCAAISAAKADPSASVILLEKGERIGQKILVTGNGRCNFSNADCSLERYNPGAARYAAIFSGAEDDGDFFAGLGLASRTDTEGRRYPYSNQASSVLDALRFAVEAAGIETKLSFAADSVVRKGETFCIRSITESVMARRVIVCTGTQAGKKENGGAGIYGSLKKLGAELSCFEPALVPLRVDRESVKSLKGVRIRSGCSLSADGRFLRTENGEVQFGDGYIGGICILNLSREVKNDGRRYRVTLDLVPEMTEEKLSGFLLGSIPEREKQNAGEALTGLLPKAAGQIILKTCIPGCSRMTCGDIDTGSIRRMASMIKNWSFDVTGTESVSKAQICRGGIDNLDPATLELESCRGIYACGEAVNVDADCGGYNLHWAWISGQTAGKYAAESLR